MMTFFTWTSVAVLADSASAENYLYHGRDGSVTIYAEDSRQPDTTVLLKKGEYYSRGTIDLLGPRYDMYFNGYVRKTSPNARSGRNQYETDTHYEYKGPETTETYTDRRGVIRTRTFKSGDYIEGYALTNSLKHLQKYIVRGTGALAVLAVGAAAMGVSPGVEAASTRQSVEMNSSAPAPLSVKGSNIGQRNAVLSDDGLVSRSAGSDQRPATVQTSK